MSRMNAWAARAAVNRWRNTGGPERQSWQRFDWMAMVRHEMRRAQLGIDAPTAWCGRNARLRRLVASIGRFAPPRLP